MPDVAGDSSCGAITTGLTPIDGSIEILGDHDWYRIEMTAGQQITVALNAAGATPLGDPYLIIRDQLGNVVDFNDDGGDGTNSLLTFATTAGGTYYIDVGSYQNFTDGDYQLTVSHTPGLPIYSIGQIAGQLRTGGLHLNVVSGGSISVNVTALNAEGQLFAREALALWTDVTGVNFVEVASGGQISFDDSGLGRADCTRVYSPSTGIISSAHINIGTDWIAGDGTNLNSYSFQTYLHEIGHALGLSHAGNYDGSASYSTDALFRNDSRVMTVMSYFSALQNPYFVDQGFTAGYSLSPMLADIYAVRAIYGAATTTRTGDTVYGFNSTAGRAVFDAAICPGGRYTIVDNGGTDTLDYSGYSANQTINLGSVTYDAGWMTFSNVGGGVGNVCIAPGTIIENAIGGSGNDILVANGANNVLNGGAGNDTASYVNSFFQPIVVSLSLVGPQFTGISGTDTLISIENLTGGNGNDTLTGDASANILIGGGGGDWLIGGAGNDRLIGGASVDRLAGGEGDDYLEGGVAYDIADYTQAAQGVRVDLSFSGAQDTGGAGIDTLVSVESIDGSAFDDLLTGNSDYNRIYGFQGNDVLRGGAFFDYLFGNEGDDYLDGGEGDDFLEGGSGNDIYVVDSLADTITEAAGDSADEIRTDLATFSLGSFATIENLRGYGAVDQLLTGHSGNNRIDGGAGADLMTGGLGDDTYFVDNPGDAIVENDGEGLDGVRSSISLTLAANVENLLLTGTAAINGIGNALANVLTGNAAANILNGGTGADSLRGGGGNDSYYVDNVGDRVVESAGAGIDGVKSSISFTLSVNVENLLLTGIAAINGTGNDLANIITGNAAANVLDGRAGADSLRGGAGDDRYVVDDAGDVVVENAGAGIDTVSSSVSLTLADNVEQLILTGTAALSGTGNALANIITGNAGGNTLSGGAGADSLRGGAGGDAYVVDDSGDTIVEAAGGGNDLVRSSVSFTLAANVEYLVLTGAGAIDGTGNALANIITGNASANILNGGAGADALRGGGGNDTYVVDHAGDSIVETAGAGTDLVRAAVSFTLAANVEDMILFGAAGFDGTGNAVANSIVGNGLANSLSGGGGNDVLRGMAGADTLVGGAGNDLLTGGTGLDRFLFDSALDAAGNTDRIVDFSVADDTIVLDATIFAALGAGPGLAAGAFFAGAAAHDASDRIIHHAATGNIYYDADGTGAGAQVLFAQVAAGLVLTSADFGIVG